jgi:hypothetical protein
MAFRHVIVGRRIVARQRERVEMLARNGHDTTEAKRTLDLFARTLNIFEDGLKKILADEGTPPELTRLLAKVGAAVRTSKRLCIACAQRRALWMELEAELAARTRDNINGSRALMAWVDALASAVCCGPIGGPAS